MGDCRGGGGVAFGAGGDVSLWMVVMGVQSLVRPILRGLEGFGGIQGFEGCMGPDCV